MGGCYSGSYRYSKPRAVKSEDDWISGFKKSLTKFKNSGNLVDLVKAYRAYIANKSSGFIAELAKLKGIGDAADIPKEFPEIEYEVKFDISVRGKGKEPEVVKYLDAFDFPPSNTARFLKDPMNTFAVGVNHFYGDSSDEMLVVIEKAGGVFLKEKGLVTPVESDSLYSSIVMKRTEKRWKATLDEALQKVSELTKEKGIKYRGKIRKEKGDAFVLDTNDGRIYSFTITRAHLVLPGESNESSTQRQLELEYAGYIPGFSGHTKDSEKELVSGMVDLAKYTYALYSHSPITDGWKMDLQLTSERKYDFILGKNGKSLNHTVPLCLPLERRVRETVRV
ncbi:MAG: hypothetical protein Q8N99_02885 [Nanoarchaeota archaeon]|nr:hypothetical protein [Nanoarchaeota archaeon]